jgi:GLPGLI family protein
MKIKLFTTAILLCTFIINAQNFTGKAIYKTHRKMDMKFGGEKSTVSETQQKQMEAQMKKMFQKTFILSFSKDESIYKEDAKLNSPKPQAGGMNVMIFGNGGGTDIYYKNIKEKRYVNKTEVMGKRFLIKDAIPDFKWELSGETKNIGNYTCYKATFSREEDQRQLSMDNGEAKESTKKVTVVTTAWYTPEIPISNGPNEFGGLPGLILELNEGKLTIACTEVVLNPSDKKKIEEPTKGKKITQAKYEKIMEKKSKEMMERFRSKRGGDGHQMEIRIGG